MPDPESTLRTRALVVIAVILSIAALHFGEPVILPLAVAVFLLVVTRPLYCWVERRAPRWLAVLATTLAVLLVAALVGAGFALAVGRVGDRLPELAERARAIAAQGQRWAEARGLPVGGASGGSGAARQAAPLLAKAVAAAGVTIERLGLILAFFVLGLLEVGDFREKARARLRAPLGAAVVDATGDIAHRVRRYLRALSITSLVSGVATGLFALLVGLDSPFVWGLVAFLLNYVPTVGPLVAVIPPSLYAILQFGTPARAGLVFLGVGAIQFVIGNFVDPKIEGRALSLSALVVLLSVVFWGWLWGVLGALLAVPLTVAIIALCERSERTRWVADLLTER